MSFATVYKPLNAQSLGGTWGTLLLPINQHNRIDYQGLAHEIDVLIEAGLAVFVPGHHLATGMKEGVGAGACSSVACLSPRGAQHWYWLMQQDMAEALGIERQIEAFITRYMMPLQRAGYSNPALDKFLAAVGGWASVGLRLRWPYRGVPEEMVPDIRRAVQRCLPSFFFDHLK